MAEMKTIQERLDERADKKLFADAREVAMLGKFQWSQAMVRLKVDGADYHEFSLQAVRAAIEEAIKHHHRDEYRNQEAREFLQQFDVLRSQIEDVAASVPS